MVPGDDLERAGGHPRAGGLAAGCGLDEARNRTRIAEVAQPLEGTESGWTLKLCRAEQEQQVVWPAVPADDLTQRARHARTLGRERLRLVVDALPLAEQEERH